MICYLLGLEIMQMPIDKEIAREIGINYAGDSGDIFSSTGAEWGDFEAAYPYKVAGKAKEWEKSMAASKPTMEQLLSGWGSQYAESGAEIDRQLAGFVRTAQDMDTQYPIDDELSSLLGQYAALYSQYSQSGSIPNLRNSNIPTPKIGREAPVFIPFSGDPLSGWWGSYGGDTIGEGGGTGFGYTWQY